ncbi:MAG: glucose-6-phosphate isomerase family protein [Candidatus Hadarchaeia archaeon]
MYEILEFGEVKRKADVRRAKDMEEVIIDKEWLKRNRETELYYMYRDLWKKGDKETIERNNLRYDITIIPDEKMGEEYVKTKGHYHPEASEGVTYPELYAVLEGKAHYILQKVVKGKLEDVVLIRAETGEKALIPPGYGHITINTGDKPLKMANWVDSTFDSIYGDMLNLEGGAYYELTTGEFIENENYESVPELREAEPTVISDLGIEKDKDMYSLIDNPENLKFLSEPQSYKSVFEDII